MKKKTAFLLCAIFYLCGVIDGLFFSALGNKIAAKIAVCKEKAKNC